jgi:hypothetical protein
MYVWRNDQSELSVKAWKYYSNILPIGGNNNVAQNKQELHT